MMWEEVMSRVIVSCCRHQLNNLIPEAGPPPAAVDLLLSAAPGHRSRLWLEVHLFTATIIDPRRGGFFQQIDGRSSVLLAGAD